MPYCKLYKYYFLGNSYQGKDSSNGLEKGGHNFERELLEEIGIMTDKNGSVLCVGDYVEYNRPLNSIESAIEFGKIFEVYKNGVFMTIRGGCFFCDIANQLRLLTDEEAMLKKLES